MSRAAAVGVALLLLVAGCAGSTSTASTPTTTPADAWESDSTVTLTGHSAGSESCVLDVETEVAENETVVVYQSDENTVNTTQSPVVALTANRDAVVWSRPGWNVTALALDADAGHVETLATLRLTDDCETERRST